MPAILTVWTFTEMNSLWLGKCLFEWLLNQTAWCLYLWVHYNKMVLFNKSKMVYYQVGKENKECFFRSWCGRALTALSYHLPAVPQAGGHVFNTGSFGGLKSVSRLGMLHWQAWEICLKLNLVSSSNDLLNASSGTYFLGFLWLLNKKLEACEIALPYT